MPVDASFIDSESQDNIFEYSNIYFETESHENISVNESDLETRAIICTHDFKSGYSDLHYPQSNGSCIVKRYTAKICQKCNHLVIMDLIGTTNYPKCPHK